ncbi:MAG: hypothetical protein KC656_37200, partial [Myxococcales bacterium]|nr:hypothetical protein [Myxococcales bacterium]
HDGSKIDEEVPVTVPVPPDAEGSWVLYDQDAAQMATGDAAEGDVSLAVTGEVIYLQFGAARR